MLKTGRGEINPPATNAQLRIYAMLARVRWPELESITVAVLSPHSSYSPHTFNATELDAIRDETLHRLATLDFQSAPNTGEHCPYCPASLICPARRKETNQLAIREVLENCSVSVSDLERAWARKNNVPAAQVRSQFSRLMGGIVAEKRIAPSLRQTTN
jgi:uncharacterized protein DUF2800